MSKATMESLVMKLADALEREVGKVVRQTFLESELVQYLKAQEPADEEPRLPEPEASPSRLRPVSALCSREGCTHKAFARGVCSMHLRQEKRARRLAAEEVPPAEDQAPVALTCSMPGCDQPVHSQGMCRRHFFDWVGEEWKRTRVNGRRRKQARKKSLPEVATEAKASAPEPETAAERPAGCTEPGCERKVHARGLCKRHFMMWVQRQRYARPRKEAMEKVSTSEASVGQLAAEAAITEPHTGALPGEAGQLEATPAPSVTAPVEAAIAEVVPLFPGTVDEDSVPVEFVGEPETPEEATTPPMNDESAAPTRAKDPSRCREPDCQKVVHANSLCHQHYYAWVAKQFEKKWGPKTDSPSQNAEPANPPGEGAQASLSPSTAPARTSALCSHPGCEKPAYRAGLCGKHFMGWVRAKIKTSKSEKRSERTVTPQAAKGLISRGDPLPENAPESSPAPIAPTHVERIKTCAFPGCGRHVRRQKFCAKHRRISIAVSARSRGMLEQGAEDSTEAMSVVPPARIVLRRSSTVVTSSGEGPSRCTHSGCDRAPLAKGFCAQHYMQERKRRPAPQGLSLDQTA